MTDKQLIKFVTSFRKGLIGKATPTKRCFMVCSPLATILPNFGITCSLKEGELLLPNNQGELECYAHYWIELSDGRIIDPTASQFCNPESGEKMPDVYFGERPKWYSDVDSKAA